MANEQNKQQTGAVLPCKVDFLELTVPAARFYDLLDLLGADLEPLNRGWRGYTSSGLVAGGFGRLGWNDEPDRAEAMGVHCSLGGQALGYLAGKDARWADLAGVLRTVRCDWKGHVTRLDLCWDDKSDDDRGLLDLGTMQQALEAGDYTSRWGGGRLVKGWGREQGGNTLYFGSGQSDVTARCYDKRAERLQKGHADQVDGVGHWVRFELQLRRERAVAAARAFERVKVDEPGTMRHLAGVVKGYVDFKTPSATDSNKRRWSTAPWWSAFLGAVAKCRLLVEKVKRTIDDVRAWLSRSVAPSLALCEQVMGKQQAWSWLFAEADAGRLRLGPKHRAIAVASMG